MGMGHTMNHGTCENIYSLKQETLYQLHHDSILESTANSSYKLSVDIYYFCHFQ